MKIPDSLPWCPTGVTLGSGGQAVVHLVTRRDAPDASRAALKALRNVGSRQAKERFRREIEAIKHLDHPSIVKVFDQSEPDDSFQFYVMEYYDGARTLASVIFTGSNPYHGRSLRSLGLYEQLLLAIRACEQASPPVIHRDINPKNILLLPDGSLRLIDFGICQVQDGQMLTLIDEDVGTRNYAAPECEAGNDAQIGVHSDLYSSAKVLWSTITSQRAFSREAPAFAQRAMEQMFPTQPDTWHLTLVFEKTIRANPRDRLCRTEELLQRVQEVRFLIEHGYPPLEQVDQRCPSCGWVSLTDFPQGHAVFGNPNPKGVRSIICSNCGFGFVRNIDYITRSVQRLKGLI
jgi:serine/threonine protein kinase